MKVSAAVIVFVNGFLFGSGMIVASVAFRYFFEVGFCGIK